MQEKQLFRFPLLIVLILGMVLSLSISGCSPSLDEKDLQPPALKQTEIIPELPSPTPAPTDTENPFGDWTEYTNEGFGFRFLYPNSWYGPEAYEIEGSLRLEIGSDVVYPYGTSRTEQINTVPDSYFIVIQYFENIENRTWDDFIASGWITTYLGLLDLEDGGSITTARSLTIRVKEVSLGKYNGLEYISTLSETAQTERAYAREVMAFDEDLNWLRISGFPNLVEITDESNWKEDYRRVDQANLDIFHKLVESILINN